MYLIKGRMFNNIVFISSSEEIKNTNTNKNSTKHRKTGQSHYNCILSYKIDNELSNEVFH